MTIISAVQTIGGAWQVNTDIGTFTFTIGWSAKNFAKENTDYSLDTLDEAFKPVRQAVWDASVAEARKGKLVKVGCKAHWDKKTERWTNRTTATYEGGIPSAELVRTAMAKSKAKMEATLQAMQADANRCYKELGIPDVA